MNLNDQDLAYRRLRAPSLDDELLVEPEFSKLKKAVESDGLSITDREPSFSNDDPLGRILRGHSFSHLVADARDEVLFRAREYSGHYLSVVCAEEWSRCEVESQDQSASRRLMMSGHQPELFHPGVWFKNFTLHSVAQQSGWQPINLVVDNDLCQSTAIAAPIGPLESPRPEQIAYDQGGAIVPWESRAVLDEAMFQSFPKRLRDQSLYPAQVSIADELWALNESALFKEFSLGYRIAAMRHAFEWRKGLRTLELPMSSICQMELFRQFAAQLIVDSQDFLQLHNEGLKRYRKIHHLRSQTHPFPDLAQEGEWAEVPFWIWTKQDPTRRPLFVRVGNGNVELRANRDQSWTVERDRLVEHLNELEAKGVAIRTRALTTTMFARVFLSDCFLHGIGGAKYDQLTDWLIRNWLRLEPNPILTATASVTLPFPIERITEQEVSEASQTQREMRFHPERFLDAAQMSASTRELVGAKQKVLNAYPAEPPRKAWHDQLQGINHRLRQAIRTKQESHRRDLVVLGEERRRQKMLLSREWSITLFESDQLVDRLKHLAQINTLAEPCGEAR